MKTKVRMTSNASQCSEWREGDEGYIDGYVTAADGRPYAVVVSNKRLLFVQFHQIEAIGFITPSEL